MTLNQLPQALNAHILVLTPLSISRNAFEPNLVNSMDTVATPIYGSLNLYPTSYHTNIQILNEVNSLSDTWTRFRDLSGKNSETNQEEFPKITRVSARSSKRNTMTNSYQKKSKKNQKYVPEKAT